VDKKTTIIDLFSGCGGLSYGFQREGFDVKLAIDNWGDALKTFAKNHPGTQIMHADLSKITPEETVSHFLLTKTGIDVIIGGPPCQGFSISGKRNVDDPRNKLYKAFLKFVKYFKPKVFLIENVPNLVSMAQGRVKEEILQNFQELGYNTIYKILTASEYGVPQNRKRVFFIGLRSTTKFDFPETTHGRNKKLIITIKDAIDDLPENTLPEGSEYPSQPITEYQKKIRGYSQAVYNHRATIHNPRTINIIKLVPDGGNYKNLPKNLQNTRRVNIAWTRMNSNKPSYTIDTGHNHHFHYKYNRVLTPRESARIQSFPDQFIFIGNHTSQLKQIGNAVPPILAQQLAKKIKKFLK